MSDQDFQIRPWDQVSDLLPPLSSSEFAILERSIRKDGVKEPITVLPDGHIIDGHHRWSIAGDKCPYKVEDVGEESARRLALTLNWARRQMSKEQQEAILKKLDKEGKKELVAELRQNGMTQAEVAEEIGVDQKTVSNWENDTEENMTNRNFPISHMPPDYRVRVPKSQHRAIYDRNLAGETQEQIAADYKVTQSGIARILKKVRRQIQKEEAETEITPVPKESQPLLIVGKAESTGLPSDSVDLIITSPPYNLGSEKWPMGGDGREPREDGIGYTDSMAEEDYQDWQIRCLVELFRVAKDGASFFYNHKVRQKNGTIIHPLDWLRDKHNPWTIRQEIVWDRGSTHNHCPTLFWPQDERIYWMTKGNPTLPNRSIGRPSVWKFHGPVAGTWHPAPFTEELPKMCIEAIGRDGITALDPFAGSCTTIKIALEYGYRAIGIDISSEYLNNAIKEQGWTSSSVDEKAQSQEIDSSNSIKS